MEGWFHETRSFDHRIGTIQDKIQARLGVEHGPNSLVYNQQKQPDKLDWCFQVFVILCATQKHLPKQDDKITIDKQRFSECVETTNQQLSVFSSWDPASFILQNCSGFGAVG